MAANWSVNGRAAGLNPADRGLAYGDGLFETMAAQNGSIRWLDRHLQRLIAGCERLEIPAPAIDKVRRWIAARTPRHGRFVVKLIVTRGVGARGYRPPEDPQPTVIVGTAPWPDQPGAHYTSGMELIFCELRLGENPKLAGLKHLCRLEQVLAQLELTHRGADEGLLLSAGGLVISGTSNNLFALYGSRLRTPRLDRCGVRGVMRGVVLESCNAVGLTGEEGDIDVDALLGADEVFVTNAVLGVRPVRRIGTTTFAVGPYTQSIIEHVSGGVGA